MLTNKNQIASAIALRDVAEKEFAQLLGEDYICAGTASDSSGRYGKQRKPETTLHVARYHCCSHDNNALLPLDRQWKVVHDLRPRAGHYSGPIPHRRVEHVRARALLQPHCSLVS